jgi:FkbM family methyltransferase
VARDLKQIVRQAQRDLAHVLDECAQGRFAPETTLLDVLFAYRLFLRRIPETLTPAFLASIQALGPSVLNLGQSFLASPEFRTLYYGRPQRKEGRVVFVPDGDLRVAVDLDDLHIGWRIINGEYERRIRWIIEEIVQPDWTCVDLGANVGYFASIMAQRVGPRGRVHAYEPFPRVLRLLEMTVRESGLADRVDIRAKACADALAETNLFFVEASDNLGGSFISDGVDSKSAGLATVRVPVTTVDADLAGVARIDFIKMDIEGAELRALRGMHRRLEADHPILVTEINTHCLRDGATADQILDFLRQRGYAVFVLQSVVDGVPLRVETKYADYITAPSADFLCVQEGRADALFSRLVPSVQDRDPER